MCFLSLLKNRSKTREPTEQELVVIASEEVCFSNTEEVCQFFRTRPVCDAHGRSTAQYRKKFAKQRSVEGSRMIRNIPGTTNTVPVLVVVVAEDQRLKYRHQCIILRGNEKAVESHSGHVNRKNSHQRLKGGCGVNDRRNRSRTGPARRPGSVHRETDCVSF